MQDVQKYWDSLTDEHKLQYLIEYSEESKTSAILRLSKETKIASAYTLIAFFKKQMQWLECDRETTSNF